MTFDPVARQRRPSVSAQAHVCAAHVKRQQAACRSQNQLHVQKALMEFLLLGKIA
ncbi:MAG: hypothetical protein PSV26_09080 [Polaromonas sp.]|uniref:hypothetical protein n=1 Tax=Polaromonas sp. TaxID=1869339 RepID=UPI002488596C|nr:hypothetical protein [Polaromonas sp.]MDI1237621.1 hypothetical protein [Polaromonas sp.]